MAGHSPSRRRAKPAPSPAPAARGRTVLVAVSGLSPAVLTETVWALAHESPAVIPDDLIVLSTEKGRAEIAAQLFGPDDVWGSLRRTLLGPAHASDPRLDFDATPDRVKVLHRRQGARRVPLVELTTSGDNTAIANAIVDELWMHTSKPDTRVIASLAGGYKTMSALCLSAMQLLASPRDRVTHVLVGGGFDVARPRFYFPEQPVQELEGPGGRPLRARDAAGLIQLIDVPFIPLRRWFEDLLNTKPPAYDVLVSQGAEALKLSQAADLQLVLGPIAPAGRVKHHLVLNGHRVDLTPHQYAYLRFFAEHRYEGNPAFERTADAIEALAEWVERAHAIEPRFYRLHETLQAGGFKGEHLGKRLYDVGEYIARKCESGRRLAALLPGRGNWSLDLPRESIALA